MKAIPVLAPNRPQELSYIYKKLGSMMTFDPEKSIEILERTPAVITDLLGGLDNPHEDHSLRFSR